MGIKLVHESLQPLTEPELFDAILDLVARARGAKVIGLAMAYAVDTDEGVTVETLQVVSEDCDPADLMDGLIDVAMDLVEEYDLEEFKPEEIG